MLCWKLNRDYDNWEEMPPALKRFITKSLKQANEGDLIPHEEVVKKYGKWFTK